MPYPQIPQMTRGIPSMQPQPQLQRPMAGYQPAAQPMTQPATMGQPGMYGSPLRDGRSDTFMAKQARRQAGGQQQPPAPGLGIAMDPSKSRGAIGPVGGMTGRPNLQAAALGG